MYHCKLFYIVCYNYSIFLMVLWCTICTMYPLEKYTHDYVVLPVLQKTNTCCQQTGNQGRSQRALWGSRWSTSQITAWRGQAWSSSRSQLSPQCITSNMTMTSTSMCMIWLRPPSSDCLEFVLSNVSALSAQVLDRLVFRQWEAMCWKKESPVLLHMFHNRSLCFRIKSHVRPWNSVWPECGF